MPSVPILSERKIHIFSSYLEQVGNSSRRKGPNVSRDEDSLSSKCQRLLGGRINWYRLGQLLVLRMGNYP
jgi:hypothetical protein